SLPLSARSLRSRKERAGSKPKGLWDLQPSLPASLWHDRQNQPAVRREVRACHALDVSRRDVHEDVELTVGRSHVVVDDGGVSQVQRLLLVRLAADDVVARELVLGA